MVKDHFVKRLKERFGYSIETLLMDLKEFEIVKNTSEFLNDYPFLKEKYRSSDTELIISERLNMVIVSVNKSLITCYQL